MLNARYIVALLVTAQIVSYSVGDLVMRMQAGLVYPLLKLSIGEPDLSLKVGPFDLGMVIGGIVSSCVSIFLSLLVLSLLFKFAWRWIERLIPDPSGVKNDLAAPPSVSPPNAP